MCRVYVLSNQACDGQCGEQLQVNMRGSCEPGWNTRLCSGSPIMVNSLCNGQCYGDLVTIRVSYFESGRLGYVMVFLLFIQTFVEDVKSILSMLAQFALMNS